MVETERLNDLVMWMRANGVRRLRVAETELEFEATPAPPRIEDTAPPKTAEDITRALHESKRARLGVELGFVPTDEMMKRLP